MKSSSCALVFIAGIALANTSHAGKDKTYWFSYEKIRCETRGGEPGYNLRGWKECTDFSSTKVNADHNRNRLEAQNKKLTGSIFEGKELNRIRFNSAHLDYVNFRKALLHRVVFKDTALLGADFRGADLSGVLFEGSPATRYLLIGAFFDGETVLSTLLDKDIEEQNYRSGSEFAFSKNMIRIAASKAEDADTEIAGGILKDVSWDDEIAIGTAVLNIYTRSINLVIDFTQQKEHEARKKHAENRKDIGDMFRKIAALEGEKVSVDIRKSLDENGQKRGDLDNGNFLVFAEALDPNQ